MGRRPPVSLLFSLGNNLNEVMLPSPEGGGSGGRPWGVKPKGTLSGLIAAFSYGPGRRGAAPS